MAKDNGIIMVVHVQEETLPNCEEPLYTIWYNGEIVMECMSVEEVRSLKLGDLAGIVTMCDIMCG